MAPTRKIWLLHFGTFVEFGPARNFPRPTSWWASSLKAQWPHEILSEVAFKWSGCLNASLSSQSKSSLWTFGSDKFPIRLSFLAPSDPYQLHKGSFQLLLKRRWNWRTKADGTYTLHLCYIIGSLLILIIPERDGNNCLVIYRPNADQLYQVVTAVDMQAILDFRPDLCWL